MKTKTITQVEALTSIQTRREHAIDDINDFRMRIAEGEAIIGTIKWHVSDAIYAEHEILLLDQVKAAIETGSLEIYVREFHDRILQSMFDVQSDHTENLSRACYRRALRSVYLLASRINERLEY